MQMWEFKRRALEFEKVRAPSSSRQPPDQPRNPPPQKKGPCLGALPFVARALSALAVFAAAAPNGGTLTDPGLIHPALGLAAGGFPVGPGGPKWAGPIYFKALASGLFRSFHRRPGWVWFVRIKGRRPPDSPKRELKRVRAPTEAL